MFDESLFTLLSQESTINALVADRIYPVILPTDATYPAITWTIVSGSSRPTLTGTGMFRWTLQFDCWADDAYLTAAKARAALSKFLSNNIVTLSDGQTVTFIYRQPLNLYNSGAELYRAACEIEVFGTDLLTK